MWTMWGDDDGHRLKWWRYAIWPNETSDIRNSDRMRRIVELPYFLFQLTLHYTIHITSNKSHQFNIEGPSKLSYVLRIPAFHRHQQIIQSNSRRNSHIEVSREMAFLCAYRGTQPTVVHVRCASHARHAYSSFSLLFLHTYLTSLRFI